MLKSVEEDIISDAVIESRCEICNVLDNIIINSNASDVACKSCNAGFLKRALNAKLISMNPSSRAFLNSQLSKFLNDVDPLYISIGSSLKKTTNELWSGFMHLGHNLDEFFDHNSEKLELPLNEASVDLIVLETPRSLKYGFEEYRRVLKIGGRIIVLNGITWPLPEKTCGFGLDDGSNEFIFGADIVDIARDNHFHTHMTRPGIGASVLQRKLMPEFLRLN